MEFILEKKSWPDLTKIRSILLSRRLNQLFFRLYSLDTQVFWNRRTRLGFGHVENLVLNQIRLVILVISWKRKKIYILFFFSAAWCYIPTFGLSPALLLSLPKRRALDGFTGTQFKKAQIFSVASQNIYIFARSVGMGLRLSYIKEKKHLSC